MAAVTRLPLALEGKQPFYIQAAAAAVNLDNLGAGEYYVITDVYAAGTPTTFTIDLGAPVLNFGDHPGNGERVSFPFGFINGDVGSAVDIAITGATNIVVLGYITNVPS